MSLDLERIRPWIAVCLHCDAGEPIACTHPHGDYRRPMSDLVDEVERLRAEVARLTAQMDDVYRGGYATGLDHGWNKGRLAAATRPDTPTS